MIYGVAMTICAIIMLVSFFLSISLVKKSYKRMERLLEMMKELDKTVEEILNEER